MQTPNNGLKNLEPLGVYEFGCNYLDVQNQTFMPIAKLSFVLCLYGTRTSFKCCSRLKSGPSFWAEQEELSHLYRRVMQFSKSKNFNKMDWAIKTDRGFELFVITSYTPLNQQA